MYIMFVLIGFSLVVALTFLGLYLWAVRTGQFDDKYTPSVRMLFDDGTKPRRESSPESSEDHDGASREENEDKDSNERTNTGDRSNGS